MASFISDELFHFVGRGHPEDHERNYLVLRAVLSSGCISHPPHNNDWGATSFQINLSKSLVSEGLLVPTVTCYCDIPFKHLGIHLLKYGKFGLSLDKNLLIKYGARPVIYVPLRTDDWQSASGGRTWLRDVEAAYRGFRTHIRDKIGSATTRRALGAMPTSPEEASIALDSVLTKDLIAFLKPYDSLLPDSHPNYYYSEREWRKFGNQKFEPKDVRRIVVADTYVERLNDELPDYRGRVWSAPS